MRKSKLCMLTLGLLACILMTTAVQARIWYVPSQVETVDKAISVARSGDVIEIAVGVHKIAGYGHRLTPGVTIRSDCGMPGGVVLQESSSQFGRWRDGPVFILDPSLSPANSVVIENITFKNFTDTFGPNAIGPEPIFNILGGILTMTNCEFDTYYGTAVKFDGGSGEFTNCDFTNGNANPVALYFAGDKLTLTDCNFTENSYQHSNVWPGKAQRTPGAIIRLESGELYCNNSQFMENGPLTYLVDVAQGALMHACTSCLVGNRTIWEGRVSGTVQLDCCSATPAKWLVMPGGSFITVENGLLGNPLSVENTSLTRVKSLFNQ